MTQTINVPVTKFDELISRLDQLTKEVSAIKVKLFESGLPYGSDAWWNWSDREALEDIKTGKGIKFDSAEKAIKWLNS